MATFKLPELGEGLSEGEVVSWRVKEGDTIKADQPMVEVMTDKATVEVPAPRSGLVKKLYYQPGQLAKVGGPLIDIEEVGEAATASSEPAAERKAQSQGTVEAPAPKAVQPAATRSTSADNHRISAKESPRASDARVLASPAVRRMAREMNIDLATIRGTGEHGRILRADLAKTPSQTSAVVTQRSTMMTGAYEERIPFIGIRRKIADHLTHSKFTAVHFTHFDEVDFTEIIKLREEMNTYADRANLGIRLSFLPFFIKGSIAALKRFPILNSSLDTERNEVVIKHYYHFGISVQTDNGLMVGVVRDCDQKDLFTIAREIKEVADRCRSGKASLQDLTGSTITITNPGNIGGLYATPVINFPEAVILGMFQIKKRPIVKEVNGEDIIVSRPMMYTNITCDHRIVDGAIAAGYLKTFCEYMENPARMAFA